MFSQGRINHWANRANVRGLALEYQNTPLLVFHVFRLFACVKIVELFDDCVYDSFGIYRFSVTLKK